MMQGEIAADMIRDNDAVDRNQDGKIQYVLLEGETGHQAMPFHLASLILQSQTKCLTILYFLSFYTFDTLCFGWHFCNTFVISPNVFICFLY